MPRKFANTAGRPANKAGRKPVPADEKHCNGQKTNGSGDLCKMPPGYGTNHYGVGRCRHHGGATEAGIKNAGRLMAAKSLSMAGAEIDIGPTEALLGEVRRAAGHVAWLQERVGLWTMDTDTEMPPFQAQWLHLYQTERLNLGKVAKMAIDAGIAQRQVQLAEQQGQLLAQAVSQILDGLRLSPEQKLMVPELVPQVLRAIAVRTDQGEPTS